LPLADAQANARLTLAGGKIAEHDLTDHKWPERCRFSADGESVIVGGWGAISRWNVEAGKRLSFDEIEGAGSAVIAGFSRDGRVALAHGSKDEKGMLFWIDTIEGNELQHIGDLPYIDTACISDDGRLIAAVGGTDRSRISPVFTPDLRAWDGDTGRELRKFTGEVDSIHMLLFSADGGKLFAACGFRGELGKAEKSYVQVWDVGKGKEIRRLKHDAPVSALALSPDGKSLLAADAQKMKLWNPVTGELLRELAGAGVVRALAFSQDGKRVVAGGDDTNLHVIDFATGRQITLFEEHREAVRDVAISPDGTIAASVGRDRTMRIWRLPN
jgi:WD40 repeat protein